MSEPITFPRKRHSHRCLSCGGPAVACYKTHCALPQRITQCRWCRPVQRPSIPSAPPVQYSR